LEEGGRVQSHGLTDDGAIAITINEDGSAYSWDVLAGRRLASLNGSGMYASLALSPDSRTVAFHQDGQLIVLTDLKTGRVRRPLLGTEHARGVSQYFPGGDALLLGLGSPVHFGTWDLTGNRLMCASEAACPDHRRSYGIAPDGRLLATWDVRNRAIQLWDARTLKPIDTIHGHANPLSSLAFSPDGRTMATTADEAALKLWDVATRTECLSVEHLGLVCNQARFSPDGRALVIHGFDKQRKHSLYVLRTDHED